MDAAPPRPGVGVVLSAGLLIVALVCACTLPHRSTARPLATSVPAPVVTPPSVAAKSVPPTTAAGPNPLGAGNPVTIAFGGDVHFAGVLATKLAANPLTVFNPAKPLYAGADIVMVNLETAITTRGTAAPKEFTFRAPASAFSALRAGGITVVTEANNHGEDYGPQGLTDSIQAAKDAAFPVVGIGDNAAEAFAPYRMTVAGQRIAMIGATDVLDENLKEQWTATDTKPGLASAYDLPHLLGAVRQARATSDTVVVYLHWGTERQTCPNERQEPLARQLVDAGADIVVGSHAHVQLGAGRHGDAFVDYGLGNFLFYASTPEQVVSGVLKVTVTGRHIDAYQWVPALISGGVPAPLQPAAATQALNRWTALRACTDLTE